MITILHKCEYINFNVIFIHIVEEWEIDNLEICGDGASISCGLDCLIILKRIIGALIYLAVILEYVAISCIIIFENLSLSQMDFFKNLFSPYFLVMIINIEYVIYKSTSNE